jgi:hypothetical protein
MQIAVCGSAPSSRMLAPFNDPTWEIWACSPQNYDFPRVDAWFEVHSLDRKYCHANMPYYNILKEHPRVYLSAPDKRLPKGIVIDEKPYLAKYGPYFFTSSLAWMMACAIEQKPKRIGIWGVDMSAAEEYGYQRAGMHYFMQKAAELGIEILLPPQSDLAMPCPLYGWKEHWPMFWKIRQSAKELEQKAHERAKTEKQAHDEKLVYQGARDFLEYIQNTWLYDTRPSPAAETEEPQPESRLAIGLPK